MKGLFTLIVSILYSFSLAGQSVLTFEPEYVRFNNGEPLPAEETFAVRGPLPDKVSRVEFNIFDERDKHKKKPVYQNSWRKSQLTGTASTFYIPVNQKLRGNRNYDIQLIYFSPVSSAHNDALQNSLVNYLETYLREHTVVTPEQIKLRKKPGEMLHDLNGIVRNSLKEYRMLEGESFEGFSDLVQAKLESLHKNRLRQVDKLFGSEEEPVTKIEYYNQQLSEMRELIAFEVQNLFQNNLQRVTEKVILDDYPTEETRTILTLHAGYGGIFLNGPIRSLNYVSGPYAGISFPLGNKAFASKFWYNTSLVAGVYMNKMEANEDRIVSGPIVRRPVYAGLSYKVFEFVRLTAGATILENEETSTSPENNGNTVYLRPFIGLQANFKLWLDLAR